MGDDEQTDRARLVACASEPSDSCRHDDAEAMLGGRAAQADPQWVPRWLCPEDRRDFQTIARRGRSPLAWEVLRRDPAYRAAHAVMPKPAAADVAASRAFTMRWGLHFP